MIKPSYERYSHMDRTNEFTNFLQMRECMKTKTCPKWSMEDPACFDHFNCTTLFRQVDCVVVCSDQTIGEFIG